MLDYVIGFVALAFVLALWDIGRRCVGAYRFNKLYWDRLHVVEEETAAQAVQIKAIGERMTHTIAGVASRVPRIGRG